MSLLTMQGQLMRQARALWTPALLPTRPAIWMDWDSPVTNVSGAASAWADDKGSIGSSFIQANSLERPTILAGELNGKRVIRFNGTSQFLWSSGARDIYRNTGAAWVFIVARKRALDVSPTNRYLWSVASGANNARFNVRNGSVGTGDENRYVCGFRRLDSAGTGLLSGPVAANNAWQIIHTDMDYANAVGYLYVDGALDTSATILTPGLTSDTESNTNSSPCIGASRFGSAAASGFSNSDVACVIAGRDSLLSTADLRRLEGWAAWQLGLASVLPSGHPFRSAPPRV